MLYLCTRNRERKQPIKNGVLVQLVRIHACHAWGHGFESRTHRTFNNLGTLTEWLGSGLQNRVQQFESAGYLNREQAITLFALFRFICHHHLKAQSNAKYKSNLQAQKRAALPITVIT